MSARIVELLRGMEIFGQLSDDELLRIARVLKEHKFAENEVIFKQGDPGEALFIVLDGRVRLSTIDQFGRERVLAFSGAGEFFGDMAVFTGAPRSATAVASTEVRLLQLRKEDFDTLLATNVELMRGMLRVMVERQTAMNTRISQEASATAGDIRGKVTAVFSPRGGAGKTFVATNLAVALAETTPDRVVVVDLDLLFGHVAMLLDLAPRSALAAISPSAMRQIDRDGFAYYLTKHPESSLRVMVGTLRPEESELVTGEHVRTLLELLRKQYMHVVVDAGSRFSEPCLAAIELADEVMVVCTPESHALHDMLECQRVLHDLLGYPAERTTFVLNHPSPYGRLPKSQLAAALGIETVTEIAFGGEEVSRSGLEGFPVVMRRSGNPASRAISAVAHRLDREAQEALALR